SELSDALAESMQAQGINVRTHVDVTAVQRDADGALAIRAEDGQHWQVDWLLWAIGRTPNTDAIGLDTVGVATDDSGHVIIDASQATNVPGVHAVGDVGSQPALTPVAIAAGRRLAERLF